LSEEIFREDAYARACEARIVDRDEAGVVLNRTVFYPMGGGQPGDQGRLVLPDGAALTITDTQKAEDGHAIRHIIESPPADLAPGRTVKAELDWERRHRLMRMHTCLHLLCRAVDGTVTGGQIGDGRGRLDFDIPEPLDKQAITEVINRWIAEDHPVRPLWID